MLLQSIIFVCFSFANAWSPTISTRSSFSRTSGSLIVGSTSHLLQVNAKKDEEECTITSSSSSALMASKPKSGDICTFTLSKFEPISSGDDKLVLEPLFDTEGTLQLVLDGGNYLPGLHKLLSTMSIGESVKGAKVDGGHGAYNRELVLDIKASDLGAIDLSQIKVGTVLQIQNGIKVKVTKIDLDADSMTLDANPPMAGAAYEVDVKLDKVEDGIKEWGYVANGGKEDGYKVATFGLGCFWGGELMYMRVPGVVSSHVGYTQGQKENPTYEEVCTGTTGHTEAIRIVYDPKVASYESLVKLGLDRLGADVYKKNQVGNDRGSQYRSGIYYHNDDQKKIAEKMLEELGSGDKEVQTECKSASTFYMGEDYHQQYLLKGGQSAKMESTETIRCYG